MYRIFLQWLTNQHNVERPFDLYNLPLHGLDVFGVPGHVEPEVEHHLVEADLGVEVAVASANEYMYIKVDIRKMLAQTPRMFKNKLLNVFFGKIRKNFVYSVSIWYKSFECVQSLQNGHASALLYIFMNKIMCKQIKLHRSQR